MIMQLYSMMDLLKMGCSIAFPGGGEMIGLYKGNPKEKIKLRDDFGKIFKEIPANETVMLIDQFTAMEKLMKDRRKHPRLYCAICQEKLRNRSGKSIGGQNIHKYENGVEAHSTCIEEEDEDLNK